MILLFPDVNTFRLVLTGGFVPLDVSLAEASVAFATDGRLSVETDTKLTRKAVTELTRLGVTGAKRHVAGPEAVSCWPQILPVVRDPNPPQLSSQAPVLFELESAADLPVIVNEMLRLGNDRQGLRWLSGDGADDRVLLRVIGPPYYTLLRAIDQTASGTKGTVRAYVEAAPRVWVQVGYTHPLAAQVKLDEGQLVVLRPQRSWTYLPEAPFRDVYDALRFELPAAAVEWAESEIADKLTVPLRLVAGNATDAPELWVLRTNAVEQLDNFVRDTDERLTQRLKFAVAKDPAGNAVIVLRVTASKLAPPVLPLADAVGFKPYSKLLNLYVPAGRRLHPPLRRDAVRSLLADDTDQLVWLFPGENDTFTPEMLPEDSFRPLEDWVDYVIETNRAPLAAWVEASEFDFEHFVCADGSTKPPRDGDGKGKRRPRVEADSTEDAPVTTTGLRKQAPADKPPPSAATLPPIETKAKGEWEILRARLQDEFLAIDGPLDHPDRQGLWPKLAVANAGFGEKGEAAICWVNGMWGRDSPPAEWVESWFQSELPTQRVPLTAAEFDHYLKPSDPQPGEVRNLVALLFRITQEAPIPAWLTAKLPTVQRYLEVHERKLPVRALWLAATRLASLSGADTLGLARVRDRVLQRLLDEGLHGERDIPRFLRNAGRHDSARVQAVQEKAQELHQQVRAWAEASLKAPATASQSDQNATVAYIDLFFAFAFAKLDETTPARNLVKSALHTLQGYPSNEDRGIAGAFLAKAFKYRIDQALAGKAHVGLLDPALLAELDHIHGKAQGQANNPHGLAHYVINRMRQQSRILEPQEKLVPYSDWMKHGDDLKKALADLPKIKNADQLAKTVRDLYRSGVSGTATMESRFFVLHEALQLSARVGEQFTLELLALVPEAMNAGALSGHQIPELPKKQSQLLERALFLATHFDRREVVQQLVDQFITLLKSKSEEQRYELVNVVAAQCLRSLRKLGLNDEIDILLQRMRDVVLGGQSLGQLRDRYRGKAGAKPDLWTKVLQCLLNLAGGWLTFKVTDQATPILEQARSELVGPNAVPRATKEYTELAQAYVAALSHGAADDGLLRLSELFRKMEPSRVANAWTTSKFYSLFHLNLVEEAVLALVSDDFALGPTGRRWLDEDEYLVRRRIHRDMRRHLAHSGL